MLCGFLNLIKDIMAIKYVQNILLTIFTFTATLDCYNDRLKDTKCEIFVVKACKV